MLACPRDTCGSKGRCHTNPTMTRRRVCVSRFAMLRDRRRLAFPLPRLTAAASPASGQRCAEASAWTRFG